LAFLSEIESSVSDTFTDVSSLYSTLNSDSLSTIVDECGADNNNIVLANATLYSLQQNLLNIRGTITALTDLTSCSSISPVFRRLFFGSTCNQLVNGLAWLYSTLLVISLLGFVVLSTRAALFNPVIRGRRSKRREKEFADYKLFMSKFYNTSDWELDWIPDFDDEEQSNVEPQLPACDSEDTFSTSDISPSDSDEINEDNATNTRAELAPTIVTSEDGSVFVNLAAPDNDNGGDDDDDSYDSTYSSDGGADDDNKSTGTTSVFSLLFHRRRTQGQDNLLSSSSSSSLLNRFLVRRIARERSGGDVLSLHPSLDHDHQNNGSDVNSHHDDDCDSAAGVMLTPPPMRYSLHRRRQQRREDPIDFELEPLTPSPQQIALSEKQDAIRKELNTQSMRSSYR
jgi:hypothetical protein